MTAGAPLIGGVRAGKADLEARPRTEDPSRVEEAAKQFESLLIAYILRSMREAGTGGWLGGGEDQTAASAMALAEEQFAQALAAQGGLGLAGLIASDLRRTR